MSYSLVQGDLDPDMEIDVTAYDATLGDYVAATLTGALSIDLRWKKPDSTVSTVSLTAIDLPTGKVKRVWVAGDTDVVGTHYGQVVVTMAGGEIKTFPNDGSRIIWNVYPVLSTTSCE